MAPKNRPRSVAPRGVHLAWEIRWLGPTQLGRTMEQIVSNVVAENPNLIRPRHSDYLGSTEHIAALMSESISVAHTEVTPGLNTGPGFCAERFNRAWRRHCMFEVTTGGQVWIGGNEAGVLAGSEHDNPCGFTAVVECRNDYEHRPIRGRYGLGPGGYVGTDVEYYNFDINQCMKLMGGNGLLKDKQVERVFDFLLFLANALQKPNARVLLHCTLAAWVNEIASLLQYGPAFTCLNIRSNASCFRS